MEVRQGMQDAGYALLLLIGGVIIYVAQHQCVKYGFDAAVDLYGQAKVWTKTQIADIKNS